MDTIDWEKFLVPYKNAVEEMKVKFKSIRDELRTMGEYSPIEFVTGRVKKISSILEKAKKLDVEPDEIHEKIEDIAGVRIMCQFVEDIYTVVDYITERDGDDLKVVNIKDYITNNKESGYRSYHVVVEYPIHTALGIKNILVEIQIRTLAMNFWATIEHSLKYKYKQRIPEHIKQRLKESSDAAFKLDQEMSQIRHEIRQAQKMFEVRSNTVSDILQNIERLKIAGLHQEADRFQERFNRLWDKVEIMELKELSREINEFIGKYEAYE